MCENRNLERHRLWLILARLQRFNAVWRMWESKRNLKGKQKKIIEKEEWAEIEAREVNNKNTKCGVNLEL
jgi:hypothetical protein